MVYLHLHDSVDFEFDGVFRREDFNVHRVYLAQSRVKRCRLTRTRRTGYDENAVGQFYEPADIAHDFVGHAELFEVEVDDALVEHAEHDAFAELRRQCGYAQVDGASRNGHFNAAVLRNAVFGYVEVRQNLYARNYGKREALGRRRHFVERAVDTVAYSELVFERLEVNVGRLVADSLLQNQVYEPDNRRFVRHVCGVRFACFVSEIDLRDFREEVVYA